MRDDQWRQSGTATVSAERGVPLDHSVDGLHKLQPLEEFSRATTPTPAWTA